jgi:hypothetical protein
MDGAGEHPRPGQRDGGMNAGARKLLRTPITDRRKVDPDALAVASDASFFWGTWRVLR